MAFGMMWLKIRAVLFAKNALYMISAMILAGAFVEICLETLIILR